MEHHFNMPRVSGLFVDLSPLAGGAVSWKQLEDRVVITWLDVPEHSPSNSNTFQIELYFSGYVRISYLSLDAADGLAGLGYRHGDHRLGCGQGSQRYDPGR